MKLKLPTLSLVEKYKLGKAQLLKMLCDSRDPLGKNTQPSVITGQKWKVRLAVENTESALKIKEIIDTVANRRAGLGLLPLHWWFKESTINKRKMVLEEIHYIEEVRRSSTTAAVVQRKQGTWTKWESAKDGAVIWSDLMHM